MRDRATPGPQAAHHEAIVSDLSREILTVPGRDLRRVSLAQLTAAIEASWDSRTAYLEASRPGNPALGQCYPTARLVQWFFPQLDIVSGRVETSAGVEHHFWNLDRRGGAPAHVDLSWSQFPPGSTVLDFEVLDQGALGDSPPTIARCQLLLERVLKRLAAEQGSA